MDAAQIYENVQERYGLAAKSAGGEYGRTVAKAFGYTEEQLSDIPKDANLGLSCGNPSILAKLREGETVIDLGSGAGFDVFLAAKRVGSDGKAIGVDMNKEMLARANRNKEKSDAANVSFIESAITDIALPDAMADCIISNCVINLVPEQQKQLAFMEMFRLLKSGGRLAISDILTKKELNDELKRNVALYVGCISGASQVQDYETYLREAGFRGIWIVDNKHDLNVYTETKKEGGCHEKSSSCCSNETSAGVDDPKASIADPKEIDLNELAASFQIYAIKP